MNPVRIKLDKYYSIIEETIFEDLWENAIYTGI